VGKKKGEKVLLPLWVPAAGFALQVILVDREEKESPQAETTVEEDNT